MAPRYKQEAQPHAARPQGPRLCPAPSSPPTRAAAGHELEELWRVAFEANPTMYFIVDDEGIIASVNHYGALQLGYAPGELVGLPVLDIFVEADRGFVRSSAESCFRAPGCTLRWEARKVRKDGTVLWVRETANAVMLESRAVLLVACEDITERKRAEDALRDSEERFRTLVQFSFDVYWETDAQHRFVRQEFAATLTDAPAPGSELGKTRWEVPYLEPDEEAWRKHRETLDAHLPFRDFELARPKPGGGKRHVAVSGLPVFDAEGAFVGYRGVGRDITERKRAEELLRQREQELRDIFETMPAMALVTDGSGNNGIGNRRWVEYTGFVREGPNSVAALHPDDAVRYVTARRHSIATGAAFEQEARLRRFDGQYRWFLIRAVPLRDARGKVLKWYSVHTDIHDRKLAEEERAAHLWFLESMDLINRAMQGTNDLEQMMSDVLDAALKVFACDRAWLIYPCDPDAPSWRSVIEHTRPEYPGAFAARDVPLDRDMAAVFRRASATRGVLVFGAGNALQLRGALAERFSICSQMVMTVRPKVDRPYLFGLHQCSRPRVWTAQEKRLFEEVGRRLDDALTSLLIFRSLRENIAELRQAQEKLGASELRHRRIFEGANVSIWELDFSRVEAAIEGLREQGVSDFRGYFAAHPEFVRQAMPLVVVRDVNDATLRLHRAESKEQLLASLERVIPDEAAAFFAEQMSALAEGRPSFQGESVVRTLQGERLTVLVAIGFPPPDMKSASTLVSVLDVTERRRAQQLTGHVFESAPDGMVVIGRDYRYQRVNPVYERSWKMPAERIIGLHVRDLHGAEVFEQVLKPYMDRCFAGEQVSFAAWFTHASGRFYLSVIYAPLRLGSDQVDAALAITRDLTDHMLASEALRDAQAALARVNRVTTLGVLAASIAHEVNQPLGAMTTSAASCTRWLAAEPPQMDKARSALQRIIKDGKRAAQVVDRIRALVNRQAPRRASVDLNEAIREVIALTDDEARRNAIATKTFLAPDVPLIRADRVQLQQVVLNLIVNAIEAMSGGGAQPRELAVACTREGADKVMVEVRDTGPGVDPDSAERLFEAFYTNKPEGIGMGLSISRSIIEAHGGQLWVKPHVPHGAAFRFSLPVDLPVS
jgi:PAS domain S-box-containing protein